MKLAGFLAVFLAPCLTMCSSDVMTRLTHFFKKNNPAHDVIVNGRVLARGHEQFYYEGLQEAADYIVSNYKRPIMVIDVMPEYGYCLFNLVKHTNITGVFLTKDVEPATGMSTSRIVDILSVLYGVDDRIMMLNDSLEKNTLECLSECEHFDVVLIGDLLKLYGSNWRTKYADLFNLAETVIMGISTDGVCPDVYRDACNHFDQMDGVLLKTITREHYEARFYSFFQRKDSVKKCSLNNAWPHPAHVIESNFYKKVFIKDGIERLWYSGMNLCTFRWLNGVLPSKKFIDDELEKLAPYEKRGANTIIRGKELFVLP